MPRRWACAAAARGEIGAAISAREQVAASRTAVATGEEVAGSGSAQGGDDGGELAREVELNEERPSAAEQPCRR